MSLPSARQARSEMVIFGLWLFFFALPLLLMTLESWNNTRFQRREQLLTFSDGVKNRLRKLGNEATSEDQIRLLLDRFNGWAEKRLSAEKAELLNFAQPASLTAIMEKQFRNVILPQLPPGQVFWWAVNPRRHRLDNGFVCNTVVDGQPVITPTEANGMMRRSRNLQQKQDLLPKISGEDFDQLMIEVRSRLHFPMYSAMFSAQMNGRLQLFSSLDGTQGLYWRRGWYTNFLGIFDLRQVDPLLGMRTIVRQPLKPGWGVGFLPMKEGPAILSSSLENRPELIPRIRQWSGGGQVPVIVPLKFCLSEVVFLRATC